MKIVKVEWSDATGGVRSGWRPLAEMRKLGAPAPAVSIGYLLREDENSIVVCPHLVGEAMDEGDGEAVIPRVWVKSITELVDAPKRKARKS